MSQQAAREYESRPTGYLFGLLLVCLVMLPAQTSSSGGVLLGDYSQVVKYMVPTTSPITSSTTSIDCLPDGKPCCRQLHRKLDLAESQVHQLVENISLLQQALAGKQNALMSDVIHHLRNTAATNSKLSSVQLFKRVSLAAMETVRVQVAVGNLRSELIMANHDYTTTSNKATIIKRCAEFFKPAMHSAL